MVLYVRLKNLMLKVRGLPLTFNGARIVYWSPKILTERLSLAQQK
jgi:hypothetical protein